TANSTTAVASENPPNGTSAGTALAMGPGGGMGGPGGRPGRGSGFGGFDMGSIFDRMANGRTTINISEMRMGQEAAQAWAQKKGITNGQLTKEQFHSYIQEKMQNRGGQMGMGGGGRNGRGGFQGNGSGFQGGFRQ